MLRRDVALLINVANVCDASGITVLMMVVNGIMTAVNSSPELMPI